MVCQDQIYPQKSLTLPSIRCHSISILACLLQRSCTTTGLDRLTTKHLHTCLDSRVSIYSIVFQISWIICVMWTDFVAHWFTCVTVGLKGTSSTLGSRWIFTKRKIWHFYFAGCNLDKISSSRLTLKVFKRSEAASYQGGTAVKWHSLFLLF